MSINKILLSYARRGPIDYLRQSAFRKFCRRTKGSNFTIKTLYDFDMKIIIGDSVDNQIFVKQIYEPELSEFFATLALSCNSFIDVGCNIGYYSCLFQRINPTCKAFCIDANYKMIDRTKENLNLNKFSNYTAYTIGVSFKSDTLIFNIPQNRHSLSSFAYVPTQGGGGNVQQTEVAVKPLFEIVDREEIIDATLKIDTEGFEYNVLSGLSISDSQLFRCIVFEFSPQNMLKASITRDMIFSIPWFSYFSHWHINKQGELVALDQNTPLDDETSVILLNKKTDHSLLLSKNYLT